VSRATGVSSVCVIESALCEWLPQTVFRLNCVLFSLYDNHHHSIHRIANTLQFCYHLRSGPLLTTLASHQPPNCACTPAVLPVHNQTSITFTLYYFRQWQAILPTLRDHKYLKGGVFYFLQVVGCLHFLQVTEAFQSFVVSFPALFRPLSTQTAVGKLGQRQLHYDRRLETNTTLVGRWGGT